MALPEKLGWHSAVVTAWETLKCAARPPGLWEYSEDRENAHKLVEALYGKLTVKLAGEAAASGPAGIEAAYAQVESLLVRKLKPPEFLRALTDAAAAHLQELAQPESVPEVMLADLRVSFVGLFCEAFAEAVKRNREVSDIHTAILLSEVHGAAHRTETKVDRLLEIVEGRAAAAPAHPLALPPPEPGACYGREEELAELRKLLIIESGGAATPVLVCSGLPGVGKSLLVETFAYEHWREHFPGGYVSLKLDPQAPPTDAAAYLEQLAAALGLPGTGAGVRARLVEPRTLLHIENVDADPLAAVCEKLLREHLRGVAVVMSSRLQASHHGRGWRAVEVEPVSEAAALAILAEYGGVVAAAGEAAAKRLVERLGYLPLAIRLVGGALEAGSHTVAGLLAKEAGFLDIADRSRPEARQQQLRACFAISFDVLLAEEPGAAVEPLRAFGHVPLAGVGSSLGCAYTGLGEDDFRRVLARASRLSLTIHERKPATDGSGATEETLAGASAPGGLPAGARRARG